MQPYYEEDGIVIYHGDCREVIPSLSLFDIVITDPPYGVTQNTWDNLQVTMACFDLIDTPLVCTCQNPASAELITRYRKRFKWSDVWEKTQAVGFLNCKIMPMRTHEDILVFADGKMPFTPQISQKPEYNIRPHGDTALSSNYGKFSVTRTRSIEGDEAYPKSIVRYPNSQLGLHPNEKPLRLMSYLVRTFTTVSDVILDPFIGSGTTLRAAKDLGRMAIGIDDDEACCETAANRLRQAVLQFA